MKRILFAGLALMCVGLMAGGVYAIGQSVSGRNEAKTKLEQEKIVTTEDAEIPNTPVTDHETAHAMADVIQKHALEATGGLSYAEMGRYMSADNPDDPAGTSDEAEALLDESGRPVPNPMRTVALQAVTLRSALLGSALAFHLAELGLGVGVFLIAAGLLGLGLLWYIKVSTAPAAASA